MVERDYIGTPAGHPEAQLAKVGYGNRILMGAFTMLAAVGGGAVLAHNGDAPAQVINPGQAGSTETTGPLDCNTVVDDCTPDPSNPEGTHNSKVTLPPTTPTSEVTTTESTNTLPPTTNTTITTSTTEGTTSTTLVIPPTHETQVPEQPVASVL